MLDFFRVTPRRRAVKIRHKNGIIYYNPPTFGKLIFHLGTGLFFISICYGIYLYTPLVKAVFAYNRLKSVVNERKNYPVELIPTPVVVESVGSTEYSITIPKIGAHASIIRNVSPFDQKEYAKVLRDEVVAQAKGSDDVGNGVGKGTFIFAHSTSQGLNLIRQNSIFYLLGELKNGDEIFVNKDGTNYSYRIYMQKVVNAAEVEYIKYTESDNEIIILQTCWPIGTDWKRLLVFGERI